VWCCVTAQTISTIVDAAPIHRTIAEEGDGKEGTHGSISAVTVDKLLFKHGKEVDDAFKVPSLRRPINLFEFIPVDMHICSSGAFSHRNTHFARCEMQLQSTPCLRSLTPTCNDNYACGCSTSRCASMWVPSSQALAENYADSRLSMAESLRAQQTVACTVGR
jgi:hypothetical protein